MPVLPRLLTRSVIPLVCLALAAVAIAWTLHARNGRRVLFTTAEVRHGNLVATISATGTIEPIEVVDVGAQVAGLIKAFGQDASGQPIDYGSLVEEGTILAKIDDSVYAADLALARAQVEQDQAGELSAAASLKQLQAKLTQTEADWRRAQELSRAKLLATADSDSFRANHEIAQANVSVGEAAIAQARAATVQARALLDKAQRNLDFCTIKSPVRGVIIDRRVNIGQTVVASLNAPSLFLLAKDLTRLQIWVAVNEADIGRITPGAPVSFTCDTFPGREFDGSVGKVRLNATMTQNVVMYTVEVNTENTGHLLLPYLTANVRFVVHGETNALLVPNAALRWTPTSLDQVSPEARAWRPADPSANPPTLASQSTHPGRPPATRVGVVWVGAGEFVSPIEVTLGSTDGTSTAIASGALRDGQAVVTGEAIETSASATHNPFIPQFRKK